MPQFFSQAYCLQRPIFFWFELAPIRSFGQSCSVTIIPDRFAQSAKFQQFLKALLLHFVAIKRQKANLVLDRERKLKRTIYVNIFGLYNILTKIGKTFLERDQDKTFF